MRARLMVLGWKVRFMLIYLKVHWWPVGPRFKEHAILEKCAGKVNFSSALALINR